MSTTETTSDTECPTCGRDDFASRSGMKIHHSTVHGESISGVEAECSNCGATLRRERHEVESAENLFCDNSCRGEWISENKNGEDHPRWETRTQCDCDNCGESFERESWHVDRGKWDFCSRDCYGEWLSTNRSGGNHHQYKESAHRTTVCEYCGDKFQHKPVDTPGVYCSNECYHQSGSTTVECTNCGKPHRRQKHTLGSTENNFCSKGCLHTWLKRYNRGPNHWQWKDNPVSVAYGNDWRKVKRVEAIVRDQARCQDCGINEHEHVRENGRGLDVHHIVPAKHFDDTEDRDDLSNLITLCRSCHLGKWEQMAPLRPDTRSAAD